MSNPGWLIVCSKCGVGEVEGYELVEAYKTPPDEIGMAAITVDHFKIGRFGGDNSLFEVCPTSPSHDPTDLAPTA